jgi:hypothetical protein
MGVFVEILQHLMTLTFPSQWDIGGITVQDGIVTVKTGSDWQGTGRFWNLSCNERVWRRFDHGLADPDISMAALMHISTFVNSLSVTSLFEMLFRRMYSPVTLPGSLGHGPFHSTFCNPVTDQRLSVPALNAKIEEVKFSMKNAERPVRLKKALFDTYNSFVCHEVMAVTLPSGISVVLDPTAAQLGWKEHVAPWDWYRKHRVHHVDQREPVPPIPVGTWCVKAALPPLPADVGLGQSLLLETIVLSLLPQIQTRSGGVKGFLRLKGGEFEVARTAVVDAAKRGVSMLAEETNNVAQMPVHFARIIPPNPDGDEKCVQIVWHNQEDRRVAKDDRQEIRMRWKARWDKVVAIEMPAREGGQKKL